MWPQFAGSWPGPPRATWVPKREAAAIACLRLDTPSQIVHFANRAEAEQADRELYDGPCDPQCQQRHVVIWTEPGTHGVATGAHEPPAVPPGLAAALRAAGYRPPAHDSLMTTPRLWPAPSAMNPPMTQRGAPMDHPETRRLQDEAVEAASNRVLVPHPGGMAGRAVAEHDAGIEALAAGDIDRAVGCEMAATALTDAVIAERPSEPSVRTAI